MRLGQAVGLSTSMAQTRLPFHGMRRGDVFVVKYGAAQASEGTGAPHDADLDTAIQPRCSNPSDGQQGKERCYAPGMIVSHCIWDIF